MASRVLLNKGVEHLETSDVATWNLWNGFGEAGGHSLGARLHHLHRSIEEAGVPEGGSTSPIERGGGTLAGEPRLVTPLHTHCGIEQRPNISPHYTTTTDATRGDAQNILWFIFGKFLAFLFYASAQKILELF